jgi:hypothetical protein
MSSSPLRKRLPSVICHSKKDRHCEEVRRSNLSLHASLSTTIETPPQSYISFEERPSLRGGKTKQSFINMHLYLLLWKRLPSLICHSMKDRHCEVVRRSNLSLTCISIYHYGNASPSVICHSKKDRHCEEVRRSNLSLHASLSTTMETPPLSYMSFEERSSLRGGTTK